MPYSLTDQIEESMKKTKEFYRKVEKFQLNLPLQPVGYYFYDFQKDTKKIRKVALIFRNISSKNISDFKGYFIAYDAFRSRIDKFDFAVTEIETSEKGEEIGFENTIEVPIECSRLDIFLETIVIDEDIVDVTDQNLFDAKEEFINISDFQKKYLNMNQEKSLYTVKAKFHESCYLCSCGFHNYKTNKTCWNCGVPKSVLKSLDAINDSIHQEIILDYKKYLEPVFKNLSALRIKVQKAYNVYILKNIKLPNINKVNYLGTEIKKLLKLYNLSGVVATNFSSNIKKINDLYDFKKKKIASFEK